jgi:hypothetical protein
MAEMNDRPRILQRLGGRVSEHPTEAHAEARATASHAALVHRLAGRPIASAGAADREARLTAQGHVLREVLGRRG